jgi:hypothetical protein
VAVSFIGGGNWRKPPTCPKSLTNFITVEHTSPQDKSPSGFNLDHVNRIKKDKSDLVHLA